MTLEQIKQLITQKSGYKITVKKNRGSMREWTRFSIYGSDMSKIFPFELRQEIKATFPPINKETGCFASAFHFDILNKHINP